MHRTGNLNAFLRTKYNKGLFIRNWQRKGKLFLEYLHTYAIRICIVDMYLRRKCSKQDEKSELMCLPVS